MRTKYSLNFFLNHKVGKDGLCKIYGRITHKRKKAEFATNYKLKSSEWNAEFKVPLNKPIIKRNLSEVESKIADVVARLEYEDIYIDAKSIRDYYTGKSKVEMNIIEFTEILKTKKGKVYSSTTLQKYKDLIDYLTPYIRREYKREDLNFKMVDYKFVMGFDLYLKTTKSIRYRKMLKPTTIEKKLEYLRTVVNQAEYEGYVKKNPFFEFKIKKTEVPIKFLTSEQLKKLRELDLTQEPILDRVRDVFIFTTYAAFRFEQAQILNRGNLIYNSNGNIESIYVESQIKNLIEVDVPILKPVKEIIEKYWEEMSMRKIHSLIPQYSNSYFNRKLKTLAKLANITMNLTHHVARHTMATTILIENGVTLFETQKFLGHKSANSTRVYAKITRSKLLKTASMLPI